MKLHLFYALLLSIVVIACGQKTNEKTENTDNTELPNWTDSHTSRNSLDWSGSYQAVIPCASCPGIETTILLSDEGTYQLTMKYLGEDEPNTITSNGSFSWNEAGNTITLEDEDPPNQYFVGENYLAKLDMDGNRISGELAEDYILRKE
ncbi:copper resistance protein NlpE [Gracilimonas sp.]|uniref:copper resistance protein NlpE n=1 Tax=Gracilimonas sp. TaxID=1974203 RepID=UPI002870D1CE|nr:copper resistance protein NlpE [Gracilimonas sp.]